MTIDTNYLENRYAEQLKLDRKRAMIAWLLHWLRAQLCAAVHDTWNKGRGGTLTEVENKAMCYFPVDQQANFWIACFHDSGHLEIALVEEGRDVGPIYERFSLARVNDLKIGQLDLAIETLAKIAQHFAERFSTFQLHMDRAFDPEFER